MERLFILNNQLGQNNENSKNLESKSYDKTKWFKENGWGYKDTEFIKHKDGIVRLSGNKYNVAGEKLQNFIPWIEENLGLDTKVERKQGKTIIKVRASNINQEFMKEVEKIIKEVSIDDKIRAFHSHGQSLQEIYSLRMGYIEKAVDLVVYPESTEQVEQLVKLANKENVVLIAFGGGTNVSQALMVDKKEERMIVSVDMTKMNHVLYVDRKSMTGCAQAGILGQDLERELEKYGVIIGHEPDSVEFSTLGGWVSTRASGMKKNKYGNIDDIVINMKVVTSIGTFTKQQNVPRVSSGPDLNHLILGSEGSLGIITEVVFKVRGIPQARQYDSYVFPNFKLGINFMRELVNNNCYPASCRLVDNQQFQLGMSLKTEHKSAADAIKDKLKKYFLLKIKGFDPQQMVLATILFEGNKQEVSQEINVVRRVANANKAVNAGPNNGERGYFLTFAIAYLRDFAMDYELIGESFETSIPWNNVAGFCEAIRKKVLEECKKLNVAGVPLLSFRITQLYQTGCAVYIYFAMMYKGIADPVSAYEQIEHLARQEILNQGGSISHHHGVGKIRKQFLNSSIGQVGTQILINIKNSLDPKNIFATQNLVTIHNNNNNQS